ncbi:ATP-binding protein [Streptomyces polyrhachis]|uniref:ATP-binding protein n=1 Tax=Streptomyces polyrhachis TaxID=1282885 RepID=A0ABW2GJ55_9ACTN
MARGTGTSPSGRPGKGPSGLGSRGGGLPAQQTGGSGELIGREGESELLRDLLAAQRLITVAGPVGVGKSALARAALTGRPRQGTPRRALRVNLAAPSTARGDSGAAACVRAALHGGGTLEDAAAALTALSARRGRGAETLLVLDDADAVHRACQRLLPRLLERLPTLRILLTCRQPLGLGQEYVLRLAPLDWRPDPATGAPAPAVRLLLRAAPAARARRGGEEAAELAAEVCRYVGGLPLAIEQAAHQLLHMPLRTLAERLRHRQCWLTKPVAGTAGPAVPARHRSLRQAVGAVYDLCSRTERVVWSRAATFAGSFTEATAVFMCAGGGIEPHQVAPSLARLAALGVVEPLGDPGGATAPRLRMPPPLRDFGRERLAHAGEFDVAHERYLIHGRQLTAVTENLWSTGSQPHAVQLLREELENVQALLHQPPRGGEHVAGLVETVLNLWFHWAVHEAADEGREHLRRLLPQLPPDSPLTVRAQWLLAWLTARADPQGAGALLDEAWPAALLAGDDAGAGRVAYVQGLLALQHGDLGAAAQLLDEAADTIPAHSFGGPSAAAALAVLALLRAHTLHPAARTTARRVLTDPALRGDTWACWMARYALAVHDARRGREAAAHRRAERLLAVRGPSVVTARQTTALRRTLRDIERGRTPATLPPLIPVSHAAPQLPEVTTRTAAS